MSTNQNTSYKQRSAKCVFPKQLLSLKLQIYLTGIVDQSNRQTRRRYDSERWPNAQE